MASYSHSLRRFWMAIAATAFAFVVSLLASINLYLLEDNNPLTQAAYSASPVLRLSYDGAYLSALVACVAVCAIVAYAIIPADASVTIGLIIIALLVTLAGFGGLLIRYPTTFLALFLVFAGLLVVSLLAGRVADGWLRLRLDRRRAAILGACVSTGVVLLVNAIAMVVHTLALNPVSHALYMQGQIGTTRLNSVLIGMGIEILAIIVCLLSIGVALNR
jgi:hypothetical protein